MPATRIGFIGAGQMARALGRGLLEADLVRSDELFAFDVFPSASEAFVEAAGGGQIVASNADVVSLADVVFLAVKPQSVPAVLAELAGEPKDDTLFVSIVAGTKLPVLCEGLNHSRVVRVMPNTPCLVGQGASAYALGPGASPDDGELVGRLLGAVGIAIELDEKLLDAVTGLSGSGPAYVYTMIEALSDGGVRMGLPRDTATALAAQTVLGAARMVVESGEHPGVLKDRVTSPGGTTIAGLQVLERTGLRSALIDAVEAATQRSQELGQSKKK